MLAISWVHVSGYDLEGDLEGGHFVGTMEQCVGVLLGHKIYGSTLFYLFMFMWSLGREPTCGAVYGGIYVRGVYEVYCCLCMGAIF